MSRVTGADCDASDTRWLPGIAYWLYWAAVPLLVFAMSLGAMSMQDGPHAKSRLRFGPNAHWRLQQESHDGAPAKPK